MSTPLNDAALLAGGMPKLLLAAENLAFIAAPGIHGRRRAGPGESFWQFRDWRDGDDAKRIDWRRSAMGERLYLKEREWDAQAGISLHLHESSGMAFHSRKTLPTKRDRAILLLLAMAALLLRAGERVALAGITPPLAGNGALAKLAGALTNGGSAAQDKRARKIEFGDFLAPDPRFASPAGGAVVQILDPAECDFPFAGRVRFEGFDDRTAVEAGDALAWRTAYLRRLAAQRDMVSRAAAAGGQTMLFHRTDAPPATSLAALYNALRKT